MHLTRAQVIELLRADIGRSGLSQSRYAAMLEVTPPYISGVLAGGKPIGPKLLARLKLEAVELYAPAKRATKR